MAIEAGKIWMDGRLIDQAQATVSVLSHALHYGTSAFEGIRCYDTPEGPAVFRLPEHVDRLFKSALILRMEIPYSRAQVAEAILDTIQANRWRSCYIRPLIWRGDESLGVNPLPCKTHLMVATWEWGAYLGAEALEKGARLTISSWHRVGANSMPTKAKAGGNYLNAALAKADAVSLGFEEALLLDDAGYVIEGSGENLFLVRRGEVHYVASATGLLGITRDSVLRLCQDLGIPIQMVMVTRDELFTADEVFLTGTAAEITPIREVDFRAIGDGKAGPITRKLQQAFQNVVRGQDAKYRRWLTFVAAE